MSNVEVLPKRRAGRPSKAETILPARSIEEREKEILRLHEESGRALAEDRAAAVKVERSHLFASHGAQGAQPAPGEAREGVVAYH